MSFLTAASERSSSRSGVSGASDASFSGASSFSFSFCAAALVLLAIRPLLQTLPSGSADHVTPTLCGGNQRLLGGRASSRIALIRTRRVSSEPLKPRLSLHLQQKPKA